MTRSYRQRKRAESQDETRQKIVEATIELHQAKGVAATSINDIAERAGVGRVTVYRHFPDESTLVAACSGQYFERHPFPDPGPWREIPDPRARLGQALQELYNFHRATAPMMGRVYPEIIDNPAAAPYFGYFDQVVQILSAGWPARGQNRKLLRAAIALAVDFDTWRRLTQEHGLSNAQARELMLRLTCDCPKT